MKRLSSSGLSDLNLGASFEPGGIIRLSEVTTRGFSLVTDDDVTSTGCKINGSFAEDMIGSASNCLSASTIFESVSGTDLVFLMIFGSLIRPFSEPAFLEVCEDLGLLPLGAKIVMGISQSTA
jgi:hypothetical protein